MGKLSAAILAVLLACMLSGCTSEVHNKENKQDAKYREVATAVKKYFLIYGTQDEQKQAKKEAITDEQVKSIQKYLDEIKKEAGK